MQRSPMRELFVSCVSAVLASVPAIAQPAYTPEGSLVRPAQYREWVFLSAGIDMSYSAAATQMGHSMFDNVFAEPGSWRAFQQTGHWPDGTMLALEVRGAQGKGSINKHGQFQAGPVMGLELHVHDTHRFKDGWGFFTFGADGPGTLIPSNAACYACHQAHAAVDTTFVQFYPTLLPIAERLKTFSEAYLRDK
jgi:Cytochrome P460